MSESFVYFIQSGPSGPVKIGVSTDIKKRLFALQAGNPVRLALVGAVPGSYELEEALHQRFAAGAYGREWFALDTPGLGEVLAHVFRFGELPPERIGIGGQSGCLVCRWAREPELADRGEGRCWRCLTHPLEPSVPTSSEVTPHG